MVSRLLGPVSDRARRWLGRRPATARKMANDKWRQTGYSKRSARVATLLSPGWPLAQETDFLGVNGDAFCGAAGDFQAQEAHVTKL